MIENPVCFDDDDKSFVENFNKIKDKDGSYWDCKDDKSLVNVKHKIKNHYIREQDYTCAYCQQRIQVDHNAAWDLDHIIPKESHPCFLFEPTNLCVSCKDCNLSKHNKNVLKNDKRKTFPKKSIDYVIVHPHFDKYEDHIAIINSHNFFFSKSEKGRKTIDVCGLLRFHENYYIKEEVPRDVRSDIACLANQLISESSPQKQHALMALISDAVKTGIKEAKKVSRLELSNNK